MSVCKNHSLAFIIIIYIDSFTLHESPITDDFQMHCKDVWCKIINPYEDILANAEIDLI